MVDPINFWSLLGLPILFTLFVWWFSTGAILYLDGLPRWTFKFSLGAASVVVGVALFFLVETAQPGSAGSAYGAFACALAIWGWVEMAFLMGFVVGPRTSACPPGVEGWQRARFALSAIFYHELALLAGAAVIGTLTWQSDYPLAFYTFATLWVSRQSTKLNLFLGVRNFSEEFLPENLRHISTYFTRRSMNLLFPLSVSIATVAAVRLWQQAIASALDTPTSIGYSLLATLVSLGLLEHWFLILPIDFGALWKWGLNSRQGRADVESPTHHANTVAQLRPPRKPGPPAERQLSSTNAS